MATLLQQSLIKPGYLIFQKYSAALVCATQVRYKNKLPCKRKKLVLGPKIVYQAKSLQQKGYLRAQKPYTPPENLTEKIENVLSTLKLDSRSKKQELSLEDKYQFLTLCTKEFNRSVPNSQLHEINTINEAIQFYQTPIQPFLPLDQLKKADLPPNLHIQEHYIRFHPDTDTKFNGESAYPRSSTIVTGLKYKKKYAGYQAKTSWP